MQVRARLEKVTTVDRVRDALTCLNAATQWTCKHQIIASTLYVGMAADKREMSRLTGLSVDTLKRYRLSGLLQENIHWIALNPRTIRFCVPLVLDWMQNRNFPELHNKAIENYQALLLSYQERTKPK